MKNKKVVALLAVALVTLTIAGYMFWKNSTTDDGFYPTSCGALAIPDCPLINCGQSGHPKCSEITEQDIIDYWKAKER